MGVIDHTLKAYGVIRAADVTSASEYGSNYPSEESEGLDYRTPVSNRPPQRRHNSRKAKCNKPMPVDYPRSSGRKAHGSKASRRLDNLNFLLDLFGSELSYEENAVDLCEPTLSAFAQLLCEKEKMKVWNDFVNLGEDEQAAVLGKPYSDRVGDRAAGSSGGSQLCADEHEDMRNAHPSYSAPYCFARIEHRLQHMLKRRHLPAGILASLENDIRVFFHERPTANYTANMESCYERLVVHAICQYLDLLSRSFECGGKRSTQIRNKHARFCPPDAMLCSFLENAAASS